MKCQYEMSSNIMLTATLLLPGLTGGPRTLVYSGPEQEYLDTSDELAPYTEYDYMVMARNAEGQVASEWEEVQTNEAPPVGVPAPRVTVCKGKVMC